MTATEALDFLVLFRQQLSEGVSESGGLRLAKDLDGWTFNPVLLPVAELAARAWLECSPTDSHARNLLHSCLLAASRAEEALEIEAGKPPSRLLEGSKVEQQHIEKLVREADARLRAGEYSK